MKYEYEFFTGPLNIPPHDDKGDRIRGIQRFVHENAKQGFRLHSIERLMGSDDFVAVMEREAEKLNVELPPAREGEKRA